MNIPQGKVTFRVFLNKPVVGMRKAEQQNFDELIRVYREHKNIHQPVDQSDLVSEISLAGSVMLIFFPKSA